MRVAGDAETRTGGEAQTITRARLVAWLLAFAARAAERRDELTELDAAIGDADHGINMHRGMQAVVAKLDDAPDDLGGVLKTVGMTLVSTVGGAAGPLYGTVFLEMAKCAGPVTELDAAGWVAALDAGVRGVQARGKAEVGDKTMIDALMPAAAALRASCAERHALAVALRHSADVARDGAEDTIPLVARKGRASYLGERSAGHQDPGATSAWLLLEAAAATLCAAPS